MRVKYSVAALASVLVSVPAQAAFLQAGGVALPGQGFITAQPGAIEERFDGPGSPSIPAFNFPFGTPGAGTPDSYVPNWYRPPRPDTAGFLSVGRPWFGASLTLKINGDFRYIGFDWGSIDEYNIVRFLDTSMQPIFFESFGTQITGTALAAYLEIPLYSSAYIDCSFYRSPIPRYINLTSSNTSFEIDNLAFATASIIPTGAMFDPMIDAAFNDPAWASLPARADLFDSLPARSAPFDSLPAPGGLALFGLALAAIARRRPAARG